MLKQKFSHLKKQILIVSILGLAAFVFAPSTSLAQPPPKPCFDFTGTGRTSFVTTTGNFQGPDINWHILSNGGNGSIQHIAFGRGNIELAFNDNPAPGYFDNDNIADIAVTRYQNAGIGPYNFLIRHSTNPGSIQFQWGTFPDMALLGDYDGDGRDDLTIARSNSGSLVWYILRSGTGTLGVVTFGSSSDFAVSGADYNGDGRDEVTVIRKYPPQQQRSSTYFAGDSVTGAVVVAQDWGDGGNTTDSYVFGDYIGDRRADFAIMRISNSGAPAFNATWYILENGGSGQIVVRQFGYGRGGPGGEDSAICGDYNGDGKQDIAVFRQSQMGFYWLNSPDFNTPSGQVWGDPTAGGGNFPIARTRTFVRLN